jgi:hypothetical protein
MPARTATTPTLLLVLVLVLVLAAACHENDPAPWGDPAGGENAGSGMPDAGDTDTGTGAADTDTDEDPLSCAEDEVADPGAGLCWMRCPLGQDPAGNADGCTGFPDLFDFEGAQAACAVLGDVRHPATRRQMVDLLGGCEAAVVEEGAEGQCDPCDGSAACWQLFGLDLETYWTSTTGTLSPWAVSFESGAVFMPGSALELYAVRCVRDGSL